MVVKTNIMFHNAGYCLLGWEVVSCVRNVIMFR